MKNFKDKIGCDWFTPKRLEELLEVFFNDSERPKSVTNLYTYLNKDYVEIEQRKTLNDEYRKLLETAELMCEEWVVNHGFGNDRSFARWYLDRYHKKQETTEEVKTPEIRIFIDDGSK